MAFEEDSWLSADNGRHDLTRPQPSVRRWTALDLRLQERPSALERPTACPPADGGAYLMGQLSNPERFAFRDCAWVGSAISSVDYPMLLSRTDSSPTKQG